jgi:hypothetical protein
MPGHAYSAKSPHRRPPMAAPPAQRIALAEADVRAAMTLAIVTLR